MKEDQVHESPDTPQVFREAFRVLKHGGRLAVSDILLTKPLPTEVTDLAASSIACVGGASTEDQYFGHMRAAGFEDLDYTRTPANALLSADLQDPMWQAAIQLVGKERLDAIADTVFSYSITAKKP